MRFTPNALRSPLASLACLATLGLLAASVTAATAQTITYKRAVKLPPALLNVSYLPLNDSGLGATDLDTQVSVNGEFNPPFTWKSRFIMANNRLWQMFEKGDGTAYFGVTRQSNAELHGTSVAERHINTSTFNPEREVLFGAMGQGARYNLINQNGQVLDRWLTGVPSTRAISVGGGSTSVLTMSGNYRLNGVDARLVSIDQNTEEITPFATDVFEATGKSLGTWISQAYGADDNLYLLDFDNDRIVFFDTGVNGGIRGSLLGSFDLDSTKTAVNSMTVDLLGNFYIGDGAGGFEMYTRDGQWLQGFHATYTPDPDATVLGNISPHRPYMNFYASGLNDGVGTLDVFDTTGYRQYTITGSTPAAPEPGSLALLLPVMGTLSTAGMVIRKRRKK